MKKPSTRLLALLLGLLLLAQMGCFSLPLGRESQGAATPEPAPLATVMPQPSDQEEEQHALWQAIDEDFFREYISSDISTLHQLVKDPAAFGIDYDQVERTLGTFSADEEREWYTFVEELLVRMDALDRESLNQRDALSYDTLFQFLQGEQEAEAYYGYYEPLLPYTGIQADLPIVFWFYELNSRQDVEDYLTLLEDVPRFFEDLLTYETYRARELGIFMVEANLDKVLEDIDNTLQAGEDIFLLDTFREALSHVEGLTEAEQAAYLSQNEALLKGPFLTAYEDLRAGLEALRPYCRLAVGVKATGNETYLNWFTYQLRQSCAEDADPAFLATVLYNSAMDSLERALLAYRTGAEDLSDGVSMGSVEENVAYLRELLDPLLPELPEVSVAYEEVPETFRDVFSPAFYLVPALDDWQHNTIALNGPEQAPNLLSTLAHEGFDGHLYQYVYHRQMGLSLSQQMLEETAYAEAWSQYSERLLAEHIDKKYRKADLQLDHYFEQCIVALVGYASIRVNVYGDSFQDVYQLFAEFFTYTESEFRELIYDPYIIGSPFYYMPYAYGYARLTDIKDSAQAAQGRQFDEKAFHEAYLSYGPTYFNLLAQRMGY